MSGIVSGLISSFLGILGVVLIPLAGSMTVLSYQKRTGASVTTGMGAKLGGFCGLFAFLVVAAGVVLVFVLQPALLRDLLTAELARRPLDAQQATMVRQLVDTPQGRAVFCLTVLIFLFPIVSLLAVLGGALGAMMSGRSSRP